jgi:hypothetical protein
MFCHAASSMPLDFGRNPERHRIEVAYSAARQSDRVAMFAFHILRSAFLILHFAFFISAFCISPFCILPCIPFILLL